ncbi:AtpZ/AtpI family protein [bacterium]|nr:AtpZ/AtpI family protein [bacterium]
MLPDKKQQKNEWLRRGMLMFAETTGWIAFPVIGALFLGRWLDEKQGTEPLYFLSITGLAFIISSVGIGMTGVKYIKQIEKAESLERSREKEKSKKKNKENDTRDRTQ